MYLVVVEVLDDRFGWCWWIVYGFEDEVCVVWLVCIG